jgi:hypothetical protein
MRILKTMLCMARCLLSKQFILIFVFIDWLSDHVFGVIDGYTHGFIHIARHL